MNNTIKNAARGEVTFKVGEMEFTARPTFNLVATLEGELGVSVLQLSHKFRNMQQTYTEIVRVVEIAARLSPNAPKIAQNPPEFREAIFASGPLNWYAPCLTLMTQIFLTGREEPDAEKNAPKGKVTKKS